MQSRHLWFRAVTALAMKNLSKFTENRKPGFSTNTQGDIHQSMCWKNVNSSRFPQRLEDKDQRLENWKRLRAPGLPYFLRSTTRASRVSKPARLRAVR